MNNSSNIDVFPDTNACDYSYNNSFAYINIHEKVNEVIQNTDKWLYFKYIWE